MSSPELTFKDENGHLIVIMPTVLRQLLCYRQTASRSKEAAGVLIGECRGPHFVIQRISEPGPGDKRACVSVDRCGSHHQAAVDSAFDQSGGTLQYLGEWHTHPEDSPSPSHIDKSSWRKNIVCNSPKILIIVGRKRIWAGKKIGKEIEELTEA